MPSVPKVILAHKPRWSFSLIHKTWEITVKNDIFRGKMIHLIFSRNQPGRCSWFFTLNLWCFNLCVCVCVWMCVYVWMCVCVCRCIHVWLCECVHVGICVYVLGVIVYNCACECCVCVYMLVCVNVCGSTSLGTPGKPSLRSWHFEWRGSHTKTRCQSLWVGECNIFKEYSEGHVARPWCSRCGQGRWDRKGS